MLADFAGTPRFTCLQLDVTNETSIVACKDEVVKLTGGKLDILVNNASVPLGPDSPPLPSPPPSLETSRHDQGYG